MSPGLEGLSYGEGLGRSGLYSLELGVDHVTTASAGSEGHVVTVNEGWSCDHCTSRRGADHVIPPNRSRAVTSGSAESGGGSMKGKRRREESGEGAASGEGAGPLRLRPSYQWSARNNQGRRLVVVLEGAALESVKVGKTFELLNCDRHRSLLTKNGRDPAHFRPDITHQSLLMLMDSPLNRAGLLQVYIHTQRNVLIEIHPQTRVPRTFDRFCGLMVQLLHKLSVRAADGPQKLLKVIRNPVTDYLPVGCPKIGTSFHAGEAVQAASLVPEADAAVLVVGSFAHGSIDVDYTERQVSISNYPLSAALTCSKICNAFEAAWGVL
ncbi:ribosomal RNA small subunit methyltransferase NEP1 [Mobula birostris]|uniref:ribosomal RNA small subunit methyltransferase NEP1 n=1 Tax=Mobula birostris TaxID=1983395 RepID=UPI003B287D63